MNASWRKTTNLRCENVVRDERSVASNFIQISKLYRDTDQIPNHLGINSSQGTRNLEYNTHLPLEVPEIDSECILEGRKFEFESGE